MNLKKPFFIILFFLSITFVKRANAQAVSVVKDRYKSRQLENMVFMRWGGFRPKWYYILFHNKYRKGPDRRTMLQLVPTDLVIRQTQEKSEDEKEEVGELYDMEFYDAMNRFAETHYYIRFKPLFEKLNSDIDLLITKVIILNTPADAVRSFRNEQERLNGEIEIIRKGWLERGDSAEAMEDIEQDFRSLKANLIKFINLQTVNQKYLNLKP